MTRFVSLPMYDAAPDATQAFWTGLRGFMLEAGLDSVPEDLTEPVNLDAHWRSLHLLLSQACGYPLVKGLSPHVRLVGTPRYAVPGGETGDMVSVVVVRRTDPAETLADLRGRRVAINDRRSQSGYNAFRAIVAPHAQNGRFFSDVVATGAHARSLDTVRRGRADVASIDGVSFAMLGATDPSLHEALRILCLSDPYPALPLVTARERSDDDLARLRTAFAAACAAPELSTARKALYLEGLSLRSLADYDVCLAMERCAIRLGYPEIA